MFTLILFILYCFCCLTLHLYIFGHTDTESLIIFIVDCLISALHIITHWYATSLSTEAAANELKDSVWLFRKQSGSHYFSMLKNTEGGYIIETLMGAVFMWVTLSRPHKQCKVLGVTKAFKYRNESPQREFCVYGTELTFETVEFLQMQLSPPAFFFSQFSSTMQLSLPWITELCVYRTCLITTLWNHKYIYLLCVCGLILRKTTYF